MRISRAVALLTSCCLLSVVTACGGPATDELNSARAGANLYGADGNMTNTVGALFTDYPGVLAGMKGTRPLTEMGADFTDRVRAVDGSLTDFNYAGEAYDSVMISALAAQQAGTTDPKVVATYINGVTIGSDICNSFAACLALVKQGGRDIAYRGVTVRSGFTDAGEPSTTSYGTVHFGPANQLDNAKTEYLRAGDENAATKNAGPKAVPPGQKAVGAPLIFGGIMTSSGDAKAGSHARHAGARLAISEINAAGGVLGAPVQWKDGDGVNKDAALATLARHKSAGVHVLIGTGSSGVANAIMPDVVNAGLIMFSPSNTAAGLITLPDNDLYFRTAPSDVLQARAIADMIMRDGCRKVTLIGRNDSYGKGLIEGVKRDLITAGMDESSILVLTYEIASDKVKDPEEVKSVATQTVEFKPDGVLIVGLAESADVIKALADARLTIRH
jgi:ABC-type branched-subunit amino acid transport system substrate-binding protein